MADDFEKALDSLESAFSDSSRQGVRRIKTEWQKVLKYKNNLLAKENEVAAANERIAYLKELKCQNEKYLHTAQSKLQNLKQSDTQLKGKLSDLKKEEARIAEKCRNEKEYMKKKLSFYEEKWRKKHETGNPKNPQVQERKRAIFEMEELKRKLLSLEQDFQKSEKDLFHAKCERNKRSREENDGNSFKDFVVKIAQMFVDTKKMLEECEKTSQEVRAIEKNIEEQKMRRQRNSIAHDRSMTVENIKNNLNVGGPIPLEVELVEETNKVEQNFENNRNVVNNQSIMETSNHNPTLPSCNVTVNLAKDNTRLNKFTKISNAGSKDSSLDNLGNFQSKPVDTKNINFCSMGENLKDSKMILDDAKKENFPSKFEKMPSRESKVRKWMEKLRIYVPKFVADEKAKNESLDQEKSRRNCYEKKTTIDDHLSREKFENNNSIRVQKYDSFKKDSSITRNNYSNTPKTEGIDQEQSAEYKNYNEKKTTVNDNLSRETFVNNNILQKYAQKYDSFGKDSFFAGNAFSTTAKSSGQNKFSTAVEMQKSYMNIDAHLSEQHPSILKNTSKYFEKNDSTSAMDWDEVPSGDNNETAKALLNENKEQKSVANVATAKNNVINEEDYLKEKNVFELKASVEAKEEYKGYDLFSKIQQTSNQSRNIQDEKRVEKANILLGQDDKKDNIDSEIIEITTEVNIVQDNSIKMDLTDNQLDDVKANLQALPGQNENEPTKEKLTVAIPTPTIAAQLIADESSAKQPLNEPNDQVMTYERREVKEREVVVDNIENNNQTPDPVLNTYPKTSSQNTISNVSVPSPFSAAPTPLSIEPSDRSNESNPKTPMTKVTQSPAITTQDVLTAVSEFQPFKTDNPSPGFAYTTRLMFEAHPSDIDKAKKEHFDKVLPKDIMAQLAFFNKSPSSMNFPPSLPKTPDDDRNDAFLASAYEDYLEDSPPAIKAKEKSMFQFADESPEKGIKGDFFPLFGENNNGESSKDSKASGGQFTFNFGGNDEKSPEETSGFKFLF